MLGHLSHVSSVVHPGCTFLWQLFNLLHLVKGPHDYVHLNAGSRAGLAWWRCFLQSSNGSCFFPLPDLSFLVYSDTSVNYGSGGVADGLGWFQAQWPKDWEAADISASDLVPVVVAAALWGR